ncbi:MAG: MBL fold metallo-hydrolase [Bacteroidetes bacterium]|nr:MBL fold metallo-hydrolase [Bacteroidota bacterium]
MLHLHRATFNAFSENTYILYNEHRECWIIDPGMYDAQEKQLLRSFLDQQGLQPQGILNTHAHIDHIFGVQYLIDTYNIPFALHPLEAPILAGAKGAALLFGFSIPSIPIATQQLQENTELILGNDRLELRLAPGHSPGSIIFYNPEAGWAIGGDVIFASSIGRTDLPGGHHETLIQSIHEQVLSLPDDTIIYPGHGPETTVGEERHNNPFL